MNKLEGTAIHRQEQTTAGVIRKDPEVASCPKIVTREVRFLQNNLNYCPGRATAAGLDDLLEVDWHNPHIGQN